MRISDWSSDVCSSDLFGCGVQGLNRAEIDNRTAFARLAHQRQRGSAPEKHALDIDGLNAPPQSQIALFNVPGRADHGIIDANVQATMLVKNLLDTVFQLGLQLAVGISVRTHLPL